jgi:hypothetical protein
LKLCEIRAKTAGGLKLFDDFEVRLWLALSVGIGEAW